jgi:uncharacterized lipoprotein YbaY
MQRRLASGAALAAFAGGVIALALVGCADNSGQAFVASVDVKAGSMQHSTGRYSVPGPVRGLVVHAQVSDINVTGSGSGGAFVTEYIAYRSTAPHPTHSVFAGTLTLNSNCPSNGECSVSYDIHLPRAATVQVSDGVGVVKLNFLSGKLAAHTDGEIALNSVSGPVEVSSDTGSIFGTNVSSPLATLRSTVGSVEVAFAAAPASVLATTSVGSVILHVPGNVSYRVHASAPVGRIEISVPTSAQSSHVITSATDVGTVTIERTLAGERTPTPPGGNGNGYGNTGSGNGYGNTGSGNGNGNTGSGNGNGNTGSDNGNGNTGNDNGNGNGLPNRSGGT